MTLELMILLIVIIFTLFTLFIWCYDSEERKKRSRFQSRYPSRSFEVDISDNSSRFRRPNTTNPNIGFNVTNIHGLSTDFAPVGVAPGAHPAQPTHYPPPRQPPYPVVESINFPRPEATLIRASAPVQDNSQPPSYYEATKHY